MLDFIALVQMVIGLVTGLVGFPALLSLALTALEYFGKIDEAGADKVSFWANAVAFVAVFYLAVTGRLDLLNSIDTSLGAIAKFLSELLILIGVPVGFAITKAFHGQLRSAKFLGLN